LLDPVQIRFFVGNRRGQAAKCRLEWLMSLNTACWRDFVLGHDLRGLIALHRQALLRMPTGQA
jgi:hypothetical protein